MISIIIPVYNGEKYIKDCYDSLCNQTHKEFEVIFINDGSTDNSLGILENIKDRRVKIINQNNRGVAVARETGIREARGEIITFLDIDDYLENNALDFFYKNLSDSSVDIVVGGINIVSSKRKILYKIKYSEKLLDKNIAIDEVCDGRIRWQLWAKAFRKHLFDQVVTPIGLRSAEDMAVCVQLFLKSKNIKILGSCIYNYLQRETSATHAKATLILADNLKAMDFLSKVLKCSLSSDNLKCLYLLNISSALRLGLNTNNKAFREAIETNFRLSALRRLPSIKVVGLFIYRFFNLNLAKFI